MASQPNTSTLNISLPKPLKSYVDGKVASGIYGSASEFVREAIREKLEREQAKSQLAAKLIEGLESGQPIPVSSSYFARKKLALSQATSRKPRRL
jgi:antitoxin ParD1/3/4